MGEVNGFSPGEIEEAIQYPRTSRSPLQMTVNDRMREEAEENKKGAIFMASTQGPRGQQGDSGIASRPEGIGGSLLRIFSAISMSCEGEAVSDIREPAGKSFEGSILNAATRLEQLSLEYSRMVKRLGENIKVSADGSDGVFTTILDDLPANAPQADMNCINARPVKY